MFETFSYLPPLSDEAIAKQVDYIVSNGEPLCACVRAGRDGPSAARAPAMLLAQLAAACM